MLENDDKNENNTLTITTSVTDDNIPMVTISDTGPGFSKEMQDNLFTPFVTTKRDGMGLGLSISEGIISEHGGRLRLASEPGKGATFKFTLPVQL